MKDFTPTDRLYGLTAEPIKSEEEASIRSAMTYSRLRALDERLFNCIIDEALLLEFSMKVKEANGAEHEHIVAGAAAITETLSICHTILSGVVDRMAASAIVSQTEQAEQKGDA